ncbi:TrmH family RNA methyltransferase [Phycisphaerales bacterium AB-hyl4]|uniref:TrmH family RNA methyltransferase n=1 Tax=Natronomicrosphaera hydrolytica TaxID=3242702 RepID=A0ABV4U8D8_9BACT
MPRSLHITSLTNPRIKQVVRLREQRHRRKLGLFIAEGSREITRACAAGLPIVELYHCPELLDQPGRHDSAAINRLATGLPADALVAELPAAVFRKIAYVREPEGVLAVIPQPTWSWDDLPAAATSPLCLVTVGIEKPGNLGAMVRTADAAGAAAVVTAGAVVDPFNPNAIRTSTGAVFTLPTIAASEAEAIDRLTTLGYRIFASTLQQAVPHTDVDFTGPTAIVIGPEDVGLADAWLAAADRTAGRRVHIPMHSRTVDSLNAAAAAAILLFEATRQRHR